MGGGRKSFLGNERKCGRTRSERRKVSPARAETRGWLRFCKDGRKEVEVFGRKKAGSGTLKNQRTQYHQKRKGTGTWAPSCVGGNKGEIVSRGGEP